MTLDNDPSPDQVAQLAQEIYNNDLLQALVLNISKLDFEVCKKESVDCVRKGDGILISTM